MKSLFLVVDKNDGQEVFYGTIEQFDDCFGIKIGCTMRDVLDYCDYKNWEIK